MYSNDEEYRAFLRTIMKMDPTKFYETEDIYVDPTDPNVSAETIDEYNFDMNAIKQYLDTVYANTRDREEFRKLYELAAGLMFSTDLEIGLAVMMAFDYLHWFYPCYTHFMQNPAAFTEKEEFYAKLIGRLTSSG